MSRLFHFAISIALIFWLGACSSTVPAISKIPTGEGQLKLLFKGFRNDLGEALIFIYPTPLGFPEQDTPELIHLHQPIHEHQVQATLDNLPYHAYAVAVLHDENLNGQMDKSLVGFPTEGFGFSRNPKPRLGPPKYQEARFLFISRAQEQSIVLQYPTMKKLHPNHKELPTGWLKY